MVFTFREAADYLREKNVVPPSTYYGMEQGKARDLAFSIAGVSSRDQLQGVLDSLKQSLGEGLSFADWKAKVKSGEIGLDLPDYRLNNIYRTNVQTAYNRGNWIQQDKMKDLRPYLMYDAIDDNRVRPSHHALDGTIRPVDDPFWDAHYPPNGYQCRCSAISLTAAQAKARGGVTDEPSGGWTKPDKGWDYNPGKNFEQGVEEALKPSEGGAKALQREMTNRVSKGDIGEQDIISVLKGAKGGSYDGLIKVLEMTKAGNLSLITEGGSFPGIEEPITVREASALEGSSIAMSGLTNDQQAYLRVVSERTAKGATVKVNLGLAGDAGLAASRLADDVLTTLRTAGDSTAPVVYRLPDKATAVYSKGQRIALEGFIKAYEAKPSDIVKQMFVIEAGSKSGIPTSFISATPAELEWIFPPKTEFTVTKIDGDTVYIKEVKSGS